MAGWVSSGNKDFRGKGLLALTLSLKHLQPPCVNWACLQHISFERQRAETTGHGKFTQGPSGPSASGVNFRAGLLTQRWDHRQEQHGSPLFVHVLTPSLLASPVQNYEQGKSICGEYLGVCNMLLGLQSLPSLWMDVVTFLLFRYKEHVTLVCDGNMKNLREIMGSGIYVYTQSIGSLYGSTVRPGLSENHLGFYTGQMSFHRH